MKRTLLSVVVLVGLVSVGASGAPPLSSIRKVAEPLSDQYIVVLRPGAARSGKAPLSQGPSVASVASALVSRHGGRIGHVYENALQGFSVRMPAASGTFPSRGRSPTLGRVRG